MSSLGTLEFQVHLKDYTDAEADKIKKKLETLSVKLTIDGKDVTVSNTDAIKKQIEAAVKSVAISSVSVDASSIKKQVEAATKSTTPQVSVTLLKGTLSSDIQKYLDSKTFKVKLTILKADTRNNIVTALSTLSIPVGVTVKASAVANQLKADLASRSIPISVRVKDAKTFLQDLEQRVGKKNVKLHIVADKNEVNKSIRDALTGKTYKADLKLNVKQVEVQEAIRQAFAKAGMKYSTTAADLRSARVQEIQQRMALRAAKAQRELMNAYRGSAHGAYESARATVTLGSSIRTNIRLAGELGTTLGNIASVFGIKDVVRGIVQIGGQLENQKIALSSILQDGGKAVNMFSKIQSLAVKSPFGIMDLNQYAKQLSAYSIPYNELYDTMKRLADISAGVGVDMGRIILAFGQVKAAGFLKGTELRQFTEANIPMVAKLAERFGELENRMVSAGEVYDMISKKKVTFEDVKSVLWDLTSEGGMFNNMQEVLSESLASKWKNLSDAVDVMYGKISESWVGSASKKTAEVLTEMTRNWEYVASAIATALGAYLSYKAAVVLGSKQMAMAKGSYGFLLGSKQQEAATLRQEALYRKLTKAEITLISTSNQLTNADIKKAVTSGLLNKQDALRLITLGKLDKSMLRGVQRTLQISNAEIKMAQNANFAKRAMASLKTGFDGFLTSLKGLVFNPMTAWMVGISAAIEVITHFAKKSSEANERIKNGAKAAAEGYKNLRDSISSFDNAPTSEGGMMSSLKEMNSKLKDYAANWAEIMADIYKRDNEGEYVYSLSERYAMLNEKLHQTKDAYQLIAKSMEGVMESANKETDGVLDESFVENLKDASDAMGDYRKALNGVVVNSVHFEEAIQKAMEADKSFTKDFGDKSIHEQLSAIKDYEEAYNSFLKNADKGSVIDPMKPYIASVTKLRKAQEIALKDADVFMESYKKILQSKGFDLNNLTEVQKIAIGVDFTQYFDSIEGLDEETKKMFLQETIEKHLNIKVTMDYLDKVDAEKWKLELIKAAGGETLVAEVDTVIKAAADYDSVVETLRDMYSDANDLISDLKPVLLKVGLTADGKNEVKLDNLVQVLDPETQKALDEYNKAIRQRQAAINIATDQGFSLEKSKKSGSGKDPVAETWKKRADEIAKAIKMYDDWKKVEGKQFAENRVKYKEELANLFNGKYGFNLDLENPTEAYEYIQKQLDESKEKQKELKVALGVKISDAELKDAQDELKDFLENAKKFVDNTVERWDLYKKLFESTGNKTLSMNIAFGGQLGFKNQLEQIEAEIRKAMESLGIGISFDELIKMDTQSLEDAGWKGWQGLSELIKGYNEEKKKFDKEQVDKFVDIIKSSKDFAQQIADIERDLQDKLKALREQGMKHGLSEEELKRRENELIQNAEEEKTKVRFEEFKKSSDWVKVFDDLDRVSDATLDNMIAKIEEFARQGKISEEVTKQLVEAMGKLRDEAIERNPFRGLGNAVKEFQKWNSLKSNVGEYDEHGKLITQKDVDDGLAAAQEDLIASIKGIGDVFQDAQNVIDPILGVFEALGEEADGVRSILGTLANAIGAAATYSESFSNLMGIKLGSGEGAKSIGDALGIKNAGLWGAVAGASLSILSSVFAEHDKALQREIEASEAREKAIKNMADLLETQFNRNLGGIYTITLSDDAKKKLDEITNRWQFADFFNMPEYSADTKETAQKAKEADSYYLAQLASLKAQRDEIQHRREAELDKKDTDTSKVEDYENEIKRMEDEINNFAESMMETLYGIDFSDWANQFATSIVDAWAAGEDAATAYKNTVGDVMRNVASTMIQQAIIGKYLEENLGKILEKFEANDGVLDEEIFGMMGALAAGLEKKVEDATELADAFETELNKHDLSMEDSDSSGKGGLSKGIKNITEETADLLASYLNAVRASVDVNRGLFERLMEESVPRISFIAEAQLRELSLIQMNTKRNADAADKIYDLVNRVVDKSGNKLKI